MSLHSNGSGQRYRSLLARRHVVLNLSTAFLNFDFKIQVVKFITNKSKGIANWPKQRWGIEDRATIQGHRWPASELFSVILLFPDGRNGQMAFTANGYIIRLLSPEIFLRLTFLTSIDWHLSIFLPYSFNFFALQLYFFCRLTAIETLFPYVNTSHGVSTL